MPDPKKLAVDIPAQLHEAVFAEARHREQKTKDFVAETLSNEPAIAKRVADLLKRKATASKHPAQKKGAKGV